MARPMRVLSRPNLERRIEELKQDAHTDEQSSLIAGIYALREFCLEKRTNVFLVPEQQLQKEEDMKNLFNRLMDYRIIHHASSALTHKSTTGNFQAFSIDIGAYAHLRKMQGRFTEIDVSERTAKDKMRSAPVLDTAGIRGLLKNVPVDAEERLRYCTTLEVNREWTYAPWPLRSLLTRRWQIKLEVKRCSRSSNSSAYHGARSGT
jgi:hypothetical protein